MFPPNDHTITVLIPTKNRPLLLARLLRYYAQSAARFRLCIGDSSDAECAEQVARVVATFRNTLTITHVQYPPAWGGTRAVATMLQDVDTAYAVFTGDDDYLILERVREGIHFLDRHPDYSLVGGTIGTMPIEFLADQTLRPASLRLCNHRSVESGSPAQRLIDCFHPSSIQNTFDIRRTAEMQHVFSKALEYGLDADPCATQLSETAIGGASIIPGKGKKLPGLYLVMLTHDRHIGSARRIRTLDAMLHAQWPTHLRSVIDFWADTLQQHTPLAKPTAARIAEIAFLLNLGPRALNAYCEIAGADRAIADTISLRRPSVAEKILRRFPAFPLLGEWLRCRYGFVVKKDVCLAALAELRHTRDQDIINIYDAVTHRAVVT